jgi:hypothetical protein
VKEEAGDAEEQWRSGFEKAFEIQTKAIKQAKPADGDERLAGRLGKAERKRKLVVETVKEGVPGLETADCLTILSNTVYTIVRTDYHLPDDESA